MGDKKRQLKKLVQDYAVAISATVLFAVILALLLLARYGSLLSVKDISKINPLITAEQNRLAAADGSDGLVEVPPGGDTPAGAPSAPAQSSSQRAPNVPAHSGGQSPDGRGTASKPTTSPQFSARIGQLRHFATATAGALYRCRITHEFQADIIGEHTAGTVSYRWKQSDGVTGETKQVAFASGNATKTVSHEWNINAGTGNHSVTFEMLSPAKTDQTIDFQHSCSLFAL